MDQLLRRLDEFQQRHRVPAFLLGVVKKYGDDRGGQLAVLLAYYGFLSLLPLMLLLSTVLGFVLQGQPDAQHAVVNSALADFPIIGDQLRQNVHSLHGSALAVIVGGLGLLYGAQGIAQVLQFTMAQVWNVPQAQRPGWWARLARGLLLFVVLGLGLVVSTGAAALVGGTLGGPAARVGAVVLSLVVNTGLYLMCFRVLTPRQIPLRDLVPGCLVAGPAWTVLQTFGGLLVAHQLRHATAVYGFFATVIGLLSWLYLAAQLTVYAAEANAVRARRLWPRALLQPPLTRADEQVLTDLVQQEQRRPEQEIDVRFRADVAGGDGASAGPDAKTDLVKESEQDSEKGAPS
ncbi:YihY/virulence factor BrkB family protein [Streptacidiphilus monticola]|uniref:YihY/virulence factor BrkB family protein n=1 Tax=Streptacidiphilus monticola TaxID=2161674 RepID=A0ABW1G0D7_9ACTN